MNFQTNFNVTFGLNNIREILLAKLAENDAIPGNVDADALYMVVSPRTGIRFQVEAPKSATRNTEEAPASESTPAPSDVTVD